MRKWILGLLLTAPWPLAAQADVYDFVKLHLEGTITDINTGGDSAEGWWLADDYDVGDTFSWNAFYYFSEAPPDAVPEPNVGSYSVSDNTDGQSGFVVWAAPSRGPEADSLLLKDNVCGCLDSLALLDRPGRYLVRDPNSLPNSGPAYVREESRSLHIESSDVDFIHGDGLLQEFSLSGDAIGHGRVSFVQRTIANVNEVVVGWGTFVLQKVTATPGRCRA